MALLFFDGFEDVPSEPAIILPERSTAAEVPMGTPAGLRIFVKA